MTGAWVRLRRSTEVGRPWQRWALAAVVMLVIVLGWLYWLRESVLVSPRCSAVGSDEPGCPAVSYAEGRPADPYLFCKEVGLLSLSHQLSTPLNPDAVALAWARKYSNRNPGVRSAAIAACRKGLLAG